MKRSNFIEICAFVLEHLLFLKGFTKDETYFRHESARKANMIIFSYSCDSTLTGG